MSDFTHSFRCKGREKISVNKIFKVKTKVFHVKS